MPKVKKDSKSEVKAEVPIYKKTPSFEKLMDSLSSMQYSTTTISGVDFGADPIEEIFEESPRTRRLKPPERRSGFRPTGYGTMPPINPFERFNMSSCLDLTNSNINLLEYIRTKDPNYIYRAMFIDCPPFRDFIMSDIIVNDEHRAREQQNVVSYFNAVIDDIFNNPKLSKYRDSVPEIISVAYTFIEKSFDYKMIISDIGRALCINITNKSALIHILKICKKRGIQLDSLLNICSKLDFYLNSENTLKIVLLYLPAINTLIFLECDFEKDYSHIKLFEKWTNILPSSDLKEENNLSINGEYYNKKSFESLVESDFDTFIENLEIDCLLDSREDYNKQTIAVDKS